MTVQAKQPQPKNQPKAQPKTQTEAGKKTLANGLVVVNH